MVQSTENGEVSLQEAQQVLDSFSAVNLDEVSPEVVRVAFWEFVPGTGGKGYAMKPAIKEINTRVPMFLFNRMLANQKRVQKLRNRPVVEPKEEEPFDLLAEEQDDLTQITEEQFRAILEDSEPAIIWQAKEVLGVWKLTPGEEGMSLKRLLLGLTFQQIQGLFMRFFGAMLQGKTNKA